MFTVNNMPIMAQPIEIMQELKNQLNIDGISLFNKFIQTDNNIQFCCPYHKNGQEKNPSCGILTEDKKDIKAGTVHCLTCKIQTTLEKMISFCFGYEDGGVYGTEWLVHNFLIISLEERKKLDINMDRNKKIQDINFIANNELNKYNNYSEYLFNRKLTQKTLDKFNIGYDKNTDSITFPVKDIKGNIIFIAKRKTTSKYFELPPNIQKPVYGLYELNNTKEAVIICESCIDALTCFEYGKKAVALFGTGTKYQYQQLKNLHIRKYILAFDGDMAGDIATTKALKELRKNKLVTFYKLPKGKDINDLDKKEFDNLIEFF